LSTTTSSPALPYRWAISCGCIYAIIIALRGNGELEGDEMRYYQQAVNLIRGYFIDPHSQELLNGPGYPLALVPLVKAGAPLLVLRLLNALFAGVGFMAFWKLARHYLSHGWALVFAGICWLHPVLLRQADGIMTEILSQALIGGTALLLVRSLDEERSSAKSILQAAAMLTVLTMTRVIFGHVTTALLGAAVAAWLVLKSWRGIASRTLCIAVTSLVLCVPYLIYSHSITGQWMKWSNSGGELMYWLTSHHPGENGNWYSEEDAILRPELAPNHKAFFEKVLATPPVHRERLYSEKTKEHLQDPKAVAINYLSNWTRLFFGFPSSFELQRITALGAVLFNGMLLVSLSAGALLAWMRREPLPRSLVVLCLVGLIYMGGSSLAPSQPRYLLPAYPLLLLPALVMLSRAPWQRLLR
jgi:hypothetical protein